MHRTIVAVVLIGCLVSSGVIAKPVKQKETQEPTKDEKHGLQGIWFLTRIESSGVQIYPLKKKGKSPLDTKFIFDGNKFIMDNEPSGTFKVDTAANPRKIDFIDTKTGKPWTLGIYKIEGDTLYLCWESDNKRPSGFKTAMEGKDARMLTLIRQVPKN